MGFGVEDAEALLARTFAPWVAQMGLRPVSFAPDAAVFELPENPALALRGGPGEGVLCGQAIAAVADTACVLALAGANGRFRVCTTTDLSLSFVRPIRGAAPATVEIVRNGRTSAVCRVVLGDPGRAAALATATFQYLEA